MKKNSVLRLSFIVGDGQANTFNKNLYKLICVVLYDSTEPLNYYEISEKINKEYDLSFIEEEIEKIITSEKFSKDFIVGENKKILLSAKKQEKLKSIESKYNLESFIKLYIKEVSSSIAPEYLLELLTEFLYKTFSLNKQVIFDLLNYNAEDVLERIDMDNDKKSVVNDFLNWENPDKDLYIFNTISYCVDYCQLTIKKDSTAFNSIFQGKHFYLDSNVIFRLVGFNNDERKKVMNAFVYRCKDCGITLSYTNFTYNEILQTIHKYVEGIKKDNRNQKPLQFKHYKFFASSERNLDLIKLYTNWSKQPGNFYGDYQKFEKHLVSLVNDVLEDFKKKDLINYKIKKVQDFQTLDLSLTEYKKKHSRPYTKLTIETDVNNFMFMQELREHENGSSGFNINNYLISTDSRLCDWSSDIIPGSVPICVLPSVWYSLILKYRGRTNNDYRAFSLFLNMRYRIEEDPISDKKMEILATVKALDEPTYVKDKILENIYNEIIETNSIPISSAEEIVNEEYSAVIANEVNEIKQVYGKELEQVKIKTILDFAEKDVERIKKFFNTVDSINNFFLLLVGVSFVVLVLYLLFTNQIKNFIAVFNDSDLGLDISHYIAFVEFVVFVMQIFIIKPITKYFNKQTYEDMVKKRKAKLIKKYK